MRTYAIGDIHGHLDKLIAAHELIGADRAQFRDETAPVVHLGDLVDRGPDAAGVIGYLLDGIGSGRPWVVLKGNHDRMMALFLHDEPQRDPRLRAEYSWLSPALGGIETLDSYGVTLNLHRPARMHAEALTLVPPAHRTFLSGLPVSYRRGPCLYVHAGIRPGVPLEAQTEDDLLWIRTEFHRDPRHHGALVVHGHTPVERPEHHGNRVNLDTGAAFGGPLTAAVFEDTEVFILTETGRVPLLPF